MPRNLALRCYVHAVTMPQTRTTHLGYDASSSRKVPGGVIISVASSAPTKCLEAVTLSALPFAAVRFPFLVPVFDTVKAALKVSTSTVELPSQLHAKPGPWSSDLHQLAATLEAKSKCQLRATMAACVRQTAAVIATSIAVEAQEKARAPTFQIQVKVDGATIMLDAGSAWTEADVKAALHTKTTGREPRAQPQTQCCCHRDVRRRVGEWY